jgi:hypothetical protein
MYEIKDSDPLLRSRRFDPNRPSGSEITVGSISKLSAAAAELRADNGNTLAKLAKFETQFKATLADLSKRIDAQAAKVRELIADAERREAAQRRYHS